MNRTTTPARYQAPNLGVPNVLNLRGLRFMAAGEGGDGDTGGGTGEQTGTEQGTGGSSGYTPPATQADLNRIIGDRVARERARFADYDELKAQVEKVPEWETKVAEAEAAVADIPTKVTAELRTHLVALHGIEKEDADLFLTATDPETLLKQVERLTARGAKGSNYVAREGTHTRPAEDARRKAARDLFGSGG